jgi:hypothetical protein
MARTKAMVKAQNKYSQKVKRMIVTFPQDSEVLQWLRSQSSSESDLPGLVREFLANYKTLVE